MLIGETRLSGNELEIVTLIAQALTIHDAIKSLVDFLSIWVIA